MSDKVAPAVEGASLQADGGNLKIGNVTLRAQAGGPVQDVTGAGEVVVDTGIDPATGKPKEGLAQAEAPKLDKDGKPIPAAQTEAEKAKEAANETAPKIAPEDLARLLKEAEAIDPKFVPFTEEFLTTGDLSEASREKAAADFGQPRAVVDQWIAGQKAQQQLANIQAADTQAPQTARDGVALAAMGGTEGFTAFQKWADANLPDSEKIVFNDALNGAHPEVLKIVAKDFYGRYKAAGGGGGPVDLTKGSSVTAPQQAASGYASKEEMVQDMASKKYRNDPAERDRVAAKVAASPW